MPVTASQRPWLILRLVPEITRVRFYTLIDHFQSPDLVLGAPAKEVASLRGFDAALARKVLDAPRTVELQKELGLMHQYGARLLTIDDEDYPENLRQSSFPPPILYVKGTMDRTDKYSVGVVGSRHATQYGKAVAQQFVQRLATCGLTIVSGFARGIDAVAHDACLKARGRTLAILGNGLSVCYPAEHAKLAERIVEQGALVTEYPMCTSPERFNFPERNHIIAAISLGSLVVEAAEKSGALITANEAIEENRMLFAVPGDVNRLNSRGANRLITQGARLVQSGDDILTEMRHLLRGYLREEAVADTDAKPLAIANMKPLTEEERYVLELIQHEPQVFDLIAARVNSDRIPINRLSAILLALELKQAVKQLPGKLYTAVI